MSQRAKIILAWLVVAAITLLFVGILTTSIQGQSCEIPPDITVLADNPCAVYLKFSDAWGQAKARRWWERNSVGAAYVDLRLADSGPLILVENATLPYRGSFWPPGPMIEIRSDSWEAGAAVHEAMHFLWWVQNDAGYFNVGHGTADDPMLQQLLRERGWLYPILPGHAYIPRVTTSDGQARARSERCIF